MGAASATTLYVDTDGSGDYNCDGVDDQIEINYALDNTSAGDTVHINGSTYRINDSIIPADDLKIEGDGNSTQLWFQYNINYTAPISIFRASSTGNNCTIQDMYLNGNRTGVPGGGGLGYLNIIQMGCDISNVTITNLTLEEGKNDGIVISSPYSTVSNINIDTLSHSGIVIGGAGHHITVHDIYAYKCSNAGFRAYYCNDISIYNYTAVLSGNYGYEFYTVGYLYNGIKNISVYNVTVTNQLFSAEDGLIIDGTLGKMSNFTIENSVFDCYNTQYSRGYGDGIHIQNVDDVTIDSVTIANTHVDALAGLHVYNSTNISIKNSIIYEAYDGIDGENITNTYNCIYNCSNESYIGGASAGSGDISVDPLIYNYTNNDFHLKSECGRWNGIGWTTDAVTSPCIDAGDPTSEYGNEPSPNGNRINIGAYGNTIEASKSSIWAVDHSKAYYNATHPILNTVNLTGYVAYNRAITSADTKIAFNLVVIA